MLIHVHIDPAARIGGFPSVAVRDALRQLRFCLTWRTADLGTFIAGESGRVSRLLKALRSEGLIEAAGRGRWSITQAGQRFSCATAATPVTRKTAERALSQFLDRVERVNSDSYFLARAARVVLFGSLLRPEAARVSDVDVAVELRAKEADPERARRLNAMRVEKLEDGGRGFRSFLERDLCWRFETFDYLKSRSRVISLADYDSEKSLILAVPHRFLRGDPETLADLSEHAGSAAPRRRRLPPSDCPF